MIRKILLTLLLLAISWPGISQPLYRRALFMGNSYTYANELPMLVSKLASSAGDSLYYDSNTPGGYTLGWQPIAHSTDAISLEKIAQGEWDFVVLQEQSQTPAIPALRDSCMYPASIILHDSIKSANPCSRVLFFLTWGRRFGGIQCFNSYYCSPDFANFNQMQDSLTAAYKGIADSLNDWIAPAGEAWRRVINNNSTVLHSIDNSHPNLKGSYLAACVFYSAIFGKSTVRLPYTAGIAGDTALILQRAADSIVLGNASYWNLWNDQPVASFTTEVSSDTLFTDNQSENSYSWQWDFGDGDTSDAFEPVHIYSSPGEYKVTLTACDSCRCDTATHNIHIIWSVVPDFQKGFGEKITLVKDPSGMLWLNGYNGSGDLRIYDLAGRLVRSLEVKSGFTKDPGLFKSVYLWLLIDMKGNVISRGKLAGIL